MQWASTLEQHPDLEIAIARAIPSIREQLDGATADLLLVFASDHYRERFKHLPALIKQQLANAVVIGSSAGGVIGAGYEVEQGPALSITAAHLPDVRLIPFQLETDRLPPTGAEAKDWQERLDITASSAQPQFLLLSDPYTFDPQPLLHGLDQAFPDTTKIGGLASGASGQHPHALFLDNAVFRSGVVGVALSGNIGLDAIVAQGCRPIGEPLFVTAAEGNRILSLDGQAAVTVLQTLYNTLSEHDQKLLQRSLFIGIAMQPDRQRYQQGDFLIRNILGLDPAQESLSVGATLRPHTIVQFHLRDAKTSAADLNALLQRYTATLAKPAPQGALMFSCLGRGEQLYGVPNHDSQSFAQHLGALPLGGLFCNGEIGPVQNNTFLHGYTSAFGLFRPLS